MSEVIQKLNIAQDFSRYPAGRYKDDGPYSGEEFRDDILIPLMNKGDKVIISLDGVRGYGSSFLEESFGGLTRHGFTANSVFELFVFESNDESLIEEIKDYIKHGADGNM